jgi:hypothetical protein
VNLNDADYNRRFSYVALCPDGRQPPSRGSGRSGRRARYLAILATKPRGRRCLSWLRGFNRKESVMNSLGQAF